MKKLFGAFMFVIGLRYGFCQEIGDRCSINDVQTGVCRLVESCPSVYNDRNKHKKPKKFCGFLGSQPIVCCPDVLLPETSTIATSKPVPATTVLLPLAVLKPSPVPSRTESQPIDYCALFGQYVYENITIPGESTFVRENRCTVKAKDTFTTKVTVETKEFPHMVLIGSDKNMEARYFCAGALISDRFVLTSAHCILNTGAKYVKVAEATHEQYFTVAETISYPQYTTTSFYHDIGLLKLNRPVTFSPYTRPACLPKTDFIGNATSFIHSTWEIIGDIGIQFVKVRLEKMEKQRCQEFYQNVEALRDGINSLSQVCTINANSDTNGCKFNLGGPLTTYHPSTYCSYLILGVSSFAKTCGFSESPLVFTDVRPYMSWIEQNVFNSV